MTVSAGPDGGVDEQAAEVALKPKDGETAETEERQVGKTPARHTLTPHYWVANSDAIQTKRISRRKKKGC